MSAVTDKYFAIKKTTPELLFFKLGCTFQAFGPDAITAAKLLDINLIKSYKVPTAGFPQRRLPEMEKKLEGTLYKVIYLE